jgi:hypothetical protein
MPDISAYADAFRDWDGLIGQLNENGVLVPGHEALKAELVAISDEAKVLKIQQESLAGNRKAATDRFLRKVDEGREKARRIRSFIVSVLGPRSPLLPLFGIYQKPEPTINPKKKRKAKPETPSQPGGTQPAPDGQTAQPAEPDKAKE